MSPGRCQDVRLRVAMWIRRAQRVCNCASDMVAVLQIWCGRERRGVVVGHRGNAARLLQRVRAAADKSLGLRAAVVVESTLFS